MFYVYVMMSSCICVYHAHGCVRVCVCTYMTYITYMCTYTVYMNVCHVYTCSKVRDVPVT